ncbi:MAG: DNA-binding response regulator [Betaproteobacteria bacterium]|nr:DNA-binding response regulator [Betaproteobacteria bacterium]
MRILLIEDDEVLSSVIAKSLAQVGNKIDVALDAGTAAQLWRMQSYDAVLLDLNLPAGPPKSAAPAHGLDLLRAARSRGDQTPVIVLTARNRTEERVAGLNAGADDYLGKPFDLAEVEARLRAVVRRGIGVQDVVQVGRLALDRQLRRLSLAGQDLELPSREFEVLWELMSPPGRAVPKRELAEKLSGLDEWLGDNALEVFISRLRKRLQGSGAAIRTLRGIGYVMEAQPDQVAP